MRLFIAVTLNEEARDATSRCIDKVMAQMVSGNFTRRENLHITLVFIGETDKLPQVKKVLDHIKGEPFEIKPTGMGRFKRESGDLYFIKTSGEKELGYIYDQLAPELRRLALDIEDREYQPHITIGRQVVAPPDLDKKALGLLLPEFTMPVSKVSLMRSERINGVLTYTEIYSKALK